MRVSEGGVSVWFGTPDAPAPSGVVAADGDMSVTVGLQPPDPAASVTLLYRINHGPPRTVPAQPKPPDAGKQYFHAQLSGFKDGDKVEYVAIYHSGKRQIPSNQEAEAHVVTFTVGPTKSAGHGEAKPHEAPTEDFKETLRAVLKASHALSSAALEDSFIKLYFSHTGDPESFWQELEKHSDLKPHVPQLQFALQIDLLTSGHLPLIEALIKMPGVKSMRDLAKLEDSVWDGLIAKTGFPPHSPGGSHEAQAKFYAASILATLQSAFPTMTVWRIATSSHKVNPLAAKFIENLPDLDIRTARIDSYADQHSDVAFRGIATDKRDDVLKEVKRLQRLFAVSTNASTFRALLDTPFDSAHAIAIVARGTFVSHYGKLFGGETAAAEVHQHAEFINARNIHLRTTIHDAIHTPPTRGLGHHSQEKMHKTYAGAHKANACPAGPPEKGGGGDRKRPSHLSLKEGSLQGDLVKRFPNSEALFGSMSLCNCEECESAIGPAAYFVDVLDFLGHSKPNEHGHTPLDVLIGNPEKQITARRPDLAFLNLTCANTNTAMPYIDIVNEILESYIALGLKLEGSAAKDSADATSAELLANPQYINQQAYELLDGAVYPFTLPFNRPLMVARSYLNQLGASRYDILKAFQKDQSSPTVRHLLAAEVFGIGAEEFQILTGHAFDPKQKVHPRQEAEFYGYSGSGAAQNEHATHPQGGHWTTELANVANFLQRTGITYAELQSLVAALFISPNQPAGSTRELLQRIPVSHSALAELLKSNFGHPVEALVEIEMAGINAHDLHALAGDHFNQFAKMVVIDDKGGSCDPASMKLVHFDGSSPEAHAFGKLHRFIRLYRKAGWSIADLDRAISALQATEITPGLLIHLAHIKQLQKLLHITNLQVLLALWAPIDARGSDSLYRSLFLNKVTHRQGAEIDKAFAQDFPDSPVLTNLEEPLLPHLPILQSALRVSALDINLILDDCGLNTTAATLTLENVSALYRRAALAKALKLKIKDFLSLRALSERDPFHSAEDTLHFAMQTAEIVQSGYTPGQLSYILRHTSTGTGPGETEPRQLTILNLIRNLRDGLTGIVSDNVIVPDPTGSLTAQKLALIFDSSVVDGILDIVNGTVNYSASLIVLPAGVSFPPQLAKKLTYDPIAQLLVCKSPLSSADRSTLIGLSTDSAYQAAVGALFQQPLDLVAAMSSFLDTQDAVKRLVTDNPSLDQNLNPIQLDSHGQPTTDPTQAQTTVIAGKYEYILQALLPYLVVTLGGALLKRNISDSLKITDLMAQQLLDVLLKSRLDGTKAASYDLHSLQTPGLSGAYYTNPNLSGSQTNGIAATIAFDGSKTMLPSGAQSASWTGMVAPTGSGDFEFIVRTNGTPAVWVDDSTTPLPIVQASGTGEWICQKVSLKAGQLYYLQVNVSQLPAANANASLLWQSLAVRKSVIPGASLYPSSNLQAFRETYILLQKASLLINTLKLTEDEVSFLEQTNRGLPPLAIQSFPYSRDPSTAAAIDSRAPKHLSALMRAARFVMFRRDLPVSEVEVTQLFSASDLYSALNTLVATTGWDLLLVNELTGAQGFNLLQSDFQNEHWALRLKECVLLSQRLGVSAGNLFQWATISSDFLTLEKVGQDMKKCVQAQYDEATWLTIAKPLNDKLRDAQRNALVAYLLPRMEFQDSDQLFEYFLIDPQMGVCTETSRISLAHSTIQLFVQRCLMNLEDTGDASSVSPHQIDSDQWETWRKHFPYWQANYQVLLHPEHWMQQSLRDDKTPFFTDLESDLTQQEITAENVEIAYLNYLEKLQQVARLEIIGTFWQDKDPDSGEAVNTLHIFGRTFHSPHTYFYRTFENFTTWTPWQEMQVTIEGDHVMPVIWNRRLYVFWPSFTKKTAPPSHPAGYDPTSKHIPVGDSKTYWQVSLCWTELRHNKWSSKQMSKNAFDMDPTYFVEDDPARYAKFAYSFKTSIAGQPRSADASLVIQCVFHGPTVTLLPFPFFPIIIFKETTEVVGAFEVGGCNGESVEAIFGTKPWPNPITPPATDVEALTYVLEPGKTGLSLTKAANQQTALFLTGTPTPYRLLYPHQFADYMLQAPLFYQDKHSTFFVSPCEDAGPVHQVASVAHAAFQRSGAASAARVKAAAAHSTAKSAHSAPKAGAAHAPRHAAPSDVSDILMELEKKLTDISEPYSKHVSGRSSAWASHALGHNMHPPSAAKVKFETFYHPFVCEFMKAVTRLGINGLLTEKNQRLKSADHDFFAHHYKPTDHVVHPLPEEVVDFDTGPYAIYNQELFFHIPDLIHERLRQNRRYDEAIRWLKFIFDPTDNCPNEAPPERYWKYVPFKTSPRENIQQLLDLMESGDEQHSQLIADWASHPFQPYAIARHRLDAYKKNIFIKCVRTYLEHGDTLFLSDTKEAVSEAEQYYVMAAHLLGPRPVKIPPSAKPKPECYASLRKKVDTFSEGLVLLENEFPFSGKVTTNPKSESGGIQNMSRTLYFCSPPDTKLLELWDIVDDRLYKIRNCLNIEGVFRQLPLFDPPIDPGLLVRAAALGMDLGSIMGDIQSPLPPYRFTYAIQRALEMCNECKSFGGAFLAALEKHDAEVLAVMRAKHEVGILDLMHRVKIRQLDEANAQVDALNASRNTSLQRYAYYQTLNGVTSSTVPALGVNIPLVPVPSQPAADVFGIQLIPEEGLELVLSTAASVVQAVSAGIQAFATPMYVIPQISAHGQPMGVGATLAEGGLQLGPAAKSASDTLHFVGDILSGAAALSGKMGTYFRRQADWALQNNLAACEIMQIDKQIAAANIRVEIAQHELESHEKQMENAQEVLDYIANQKFTNQDLYGWMVSDIASSYFSCYQMAFAQAKKAERTFRFERGLTESNFIQFGYWDSLRKGLLAGDRLHLALLQMQAAYADQDTRAYEISRDISFLVNAPLALVALRETGVCEIAIPESFFDADYPGHYMRRIKSLTLSIPCVVGPYTSVNCKLTLLSNKIRVSNALDDQYAENVEDGDDRFVNNFAAVQSIATSHGLNDGGLFEISFLDHRYLPFEGAGVISRWRLEMRKEHNAFDFEKIADAVMHVKYTAWEGGDPLRQAAEQALASAPQDDIQRLFSLRHEFSANWASFLNPAAATGQSQVMTFELTIAHFPYQYRGKTIAIEQIECFLNFKDVHDAQIYAQDGTPLGDYAAAKPLAVSLTPPGGTAVSVPLKSDKSFLSGVPHASADVSDQTAGLGSWNIGVQSSDIAGLPPSLRSDGGADKIYRLNSDVIADLVIVCHYSVS